MEEKVYYHLMMKLLVAKNNNIEYKGVDILSTVAPGIIGR